MLVSKESLTTGSTQLTTLSVTSLVEVRLGEWLVVFLRKEPRRIRGRVLGLLIAKDEGREKRVGARHTARFWASICAGEGGGSSLGQDTNAEVTQQIHNVL